MKRTITVFILSVFVLSGSTVFAAQPGSPEYQKMKEYKAEQRKLREQRKTSGEPAEKKAPGFWDREAERSGFAQNGRNMNGWFKNLNPVPFFKQQGERYEERKASGGAK